jgi:hypothetical protein
MTSRDRSHSTSTSHTGYAIEMIFWASVSCGFSRYGPIRNVQERNAAPAVRISPSIMLARSRIIAPERVRLISASTSVGKHRTRKIASATDGNAVWWKTSVSTIAVIVPLANVKLLAASTSQGNRRRGRLRRTPIRIPATLVPATSTNAIGVSGGTSR